MLSLFGLTLLLLSLLGLFDSSRLFFCNFCLAFLLFLLEFNLSLLDFFCPLRLLEFPSFLLRLLFLKPFLLFFLFLNLLMNGGYVGVSWLLHLWIGLRVGDDIFWSFSFSLFDNFGGSSLSWLSLGLG